jgi:hypothetical protein
MKLSKLVTLRNYLNSLSVRAVQNVANVELTKILYQVDLNSEILASQIHNTNSEFTKLQQAFDSFSQQFDQIRLQVEQLIIEQEMHWRHESYRIYEKLRAEHHDYVMNNLRPTVHPETLLRSRLQVYADWRYPGMLIRPGIETFAGEMVACDPLYIVDVDRPFLGKVSSINKFTPEYEARIRSFIIDENLDLSMLAKIPNNQFGLCLVYNFFNHRPLELIKHYLEELYDKLRPGGVLIFTYNDCDRTPGVELVEKGLACYTNGTLINQLVEHIGYDRCHAWHDGEPKTFLEVRKPGDLVSLRGGQTLAKIISK